MLAMLMRLADLPPPPTQSAPERLGIGLVLFAFFAGALWFWKKSRKR